MGLEVLQLVHLVEVRVRVRARARARVRVRVRVGARARGAGPGPTSSSPICAVDERATALAPTAPPFCINSL